MSSPPPPPTHTHKDETRVFICLSGFTLVHQVNVVGHNCSLWRLKKREHFQNSGPQEIRQEIPIRRYNRCVASFYDVDVMSVCVTSIKLPNGGYRPPHL